MEREPSDVKEPPPDDPIAELLSDSLHAEPASESDDDEGGQNRGQNREDTPR